MPWFSSGGAHELDEHENHHAEQQALRPAATGSHYVPAEASSSDDEEGHKEAKILMSGFMQKRQANPTNPSTMMFSIGGRPWQSRFFELVEPRDPCHPPAIRYRHDKYYMDKFGKGNVTVPLNDAKLRLGQDRQTETCDPVLHITTKGTASKHLELKMGFLDHSLDKWYKAIQETKRRHEVSRSPLHPP